MCGPKSVNNQNPEDVVNYSDEAFKEADAIVKRVFDVDLVAKHNRRVKSPFKTRKIRFDVKGEDIDKTNRLKNRRKSRCNKANKHKDD